jgi:hypothetical protein
MEGRFLSVILAPGHAKATKEAAETEAKSSAPA